MPKDCPHGHGEMDPPIPGDPLEPDAPWCLECGHIQGRGCKDGCDYGPDPPGSAGEGVPARVQIAVVGALTVLSAGVLAVVPNDTGAQVWLLFNLFALAVLLLAYLYADGSPHGGHDG